MSTPSDPKGRPQRPVLSVVTTSVFMPPDTLRAIEKTLEKGVVDLTQMPLAELLQRFTQNREERRVIHINIAVCAVTDCFAAVKNQELADREKDFARKNEGAGHYLYRYLRANCGFPPSKATKISTYLEGPIVEGLTPADIRKRMMKEWKLEDGYNDALRKRGNEMSEATEPYGDENGGGDSAEPDVNEDSDGESKPSRKKAKGKAAASHRNHTESSYDDPPKPSKSGKKAAPAEEEGSDGHEAELFDAPPPIELTGERHGLDGQRKSFAIVYYGVRGRPNKIKFLSPKRTQRLAEEYLEKEHETGRKKMRRGDEAA